jgi:hypothetical protein
VNLKIMPENNKTEEFLQKLAPCIERGELEKCVDEAARVAGERVAEFPKVDLPAFYR